MMCHRFGVLIQNLSQNLHLANGIKTTAIALNQKLEKEPRVKHTFPNQYKNFEVSSEEWQYVDRLKPFKEIPNPRASPGEVMPSGWIAPSAKANSHPYFVHRDREHLLPVLLSKIFLMERDEKRNQSDEGRAYMTKLSEIEGDIFKLAEDIREFIFERYPPERKARQFLRLRVHEPHQQIFIGGDYVNAVKEFLIEKGF